MIGQMSRPGALGVSDPVIVEGAAEARAVIRVFRDYRKLLSWLILHAAELPTLRGIVLTGWNDEAWLAVQSFAERWASRELLVRSDSACETGSAPRGGYVVDLDRLESAVMPLLLDDRAVFLLEPASPLDDLYSVSLRPEPGWTEWLLEVVGAGFDASDLKRGDVTPHEQLWVSVASGEPRILTRATSSQSAYAASRAVRLRKAAAFARCEIDRLEVELRRRGETLLLDCEGYRPIPDHLLSPLMHHVGRLRPELDRQSLEDDVVISMSFVGREGRPVFWDVVWPDRKYSGNMRGDRSRCAK